MNSRQIRALIVVMAAVLTMGFVVWIGVNATRESSAATSFAVVHDTPRGRIKLENDVLKLEFGYKTEQATHNNQSGGNLYYYYDKRFSATQNIISVWEGGSSQTKAYASGAGGIGSTQIYAAPSIPTGGYRYALADNARDAALRSAPIITSQPDGSVKLVFDVAVTNKDWTPSSEWYTVLKTWIVYPGGRIQLQHDWRLSKAGYFSEPASRHQISTAFKKIGRWGHSWSDSVAKPPGSNSRINPANKWYQWTPNPASIQECNASDGSGGSQDAVHADYNRFYDGAAYDFWFWPYNEGLGFEGLGLYKIGYQAFGRSQNSAVNEICHHNRTSIGDGSDAYNLGPMAWWGGDGASSDRYKVLPAGTVWRDSYQMEARTRSDVLPADAAAPPPASTNGDANRDGRVNALDLSMVLGHDGEAYPDADFNLDGTVGAADLAIILARWTW